MNTTYNRISMVQLSLMFFTHWQNHEETIQHTLRCTKLIGQFGSYLGLGKEDIKILERGALFHDIGKFSIPSEVLYASRKLSEEEFKQIKIHPIEKDVEHIEPIVLAMKEQHHEYLDGSGYPRGLKKEDIHPFAQIMTIIDVYDALKFKRSYKRAWSDEEILEEMMRFRGIRYDAHYLDKFFEFISLSVGVY